MEHYSNSEEANALEMTNVVKSVTSFLNPHNNWCYKLELIPTCFFFYKHLRGPLLGHKLKGYNFLPSYRLHDQGKTKPKPVV